MMDFQLFENARLGEGYAVGRMSNGLTVCVYPMKSKTGVHAMLSAKIGSVTRDFVLGGRRVDVPAGVAHFLEHKLFEGEDEDAFALFAKTGAYANAYTSFDRTSYLFSATLHLEQSLRTLIKFVTHPHFTPQNVEKEQGIIAQEIKMYDDNPDWVLTNMLLRGLYHNHPIREDIAGTVASIGEITAQTLNDCYNAYYRPANMVLAVAGNMDPEQVAEICEQEYRDLRVPAQAVEPVAVEEPREIVAAYAERSMSVYETQFGLAFKEIPFRKETALRDGLVLRLALELLTGETSPLYRFLYDTGLANGMLDASGLTGEDYLCIVISGESSKPDEAIASIRAEIARQREEGIDRDQFEELRRAVLGAELCAFDSIEGVASKMTAAHFKDYPLYAIIDTINGIRPADVQDMLQKILKEENSTVAVIRPAHGQEN